MLNIYTFVILPQVVLYLIISAKKTDGLCFTKSQLSFPLIDHASQYSQITKLTLSFSSISLKEK